MLDLESDDVSDEALNAMIVDAMNLARAGTVIICKKTIVRRGEHRDS